MMKIKSMKEVEMYLSKGEIDAFKSNLVKTQDNIIRLKGNSIFLYKNKNILLRTNGEVVYGLFDKTESENFSRKNERLFEFTFNPVKYREPYIKSCGVYDLKEMKKIVLKAFYNAWNKEALAKYESIKFLLNLCIEKNRKKINQSVKENETMNNKVKSEVKLNTKISRAMVMKMAHKIRLEEGLEGDYFAQMSYALKKAWALIKQQGVSSVTTEENKEVAATIETKVKTEENKEDKKEERTAEEESVVTALDEDTTTWNYVFLKKIKDDYILMFRRKDGAITKMRNYGDEKFDKVETLVKGHFNSLLKILPKDTKVLFVNKNIASTLKFTGAFVKVLKEKNIVITTYDDASIEIAV